MKYTDLRKKVAEQAGITQAQAGAAIDALTVTIAFELKQRQEVRIPLLGTFATKETTARTGRNPRTGEEIQIAAKTKAIFRPATALKDAVT